MDIVEEIINSADEVHSILGPGCSESTYQQAMGREFSERGIPFSTEGTIPIFYKGTPVGKRRPDMFVESDDGMLAIELKAGSNRGQGQLFNYLAILGDDKNFDIMNGILIQFNDSVEVVVS